MKKFLGMLLAAVVACTMFAACGGNKNTVTDDPANGSTADSDLAYVKGKGKMVVGITDFEPMDFQKDGEWVGFDADMAKAFAKEIGVDVEFVEINWDNKVFELNGKLIDCVWNGMTLGDEVKEAMECTNAYCNNAQVVIVKADGAEAYKSADDCKKLTFAVEAGSAGEKAAKENGFNYITVEKQSDALTEVKAGTSDAAIIDLLMAGAMVGEGTGYADLTYTVKLTSEQYGVGFRKGSDLAAKLNEFFKKTYADGSMKALAEKYGTQETLIEQK